MGCGSSSDNPSVLMGSGSAPQNDAIEAEKIAKQQRRRLSLAPQMVGDISHQQHVAAAAAAAAAASGSGTTDETVTPAITESSSKILAIQSLLAAEDSKLTPIELQSKSAYECVTVTRKGYIPYNRNKVNQDRAIIKHALQSLTNQSLFGVADGHGEFGHLVASFVQEKLPLALSAANTELLHNDTDNTIIQSVKHVTDELSESSNINIAFSGTTCVFGIKIDNLLYIANIGDSRAVICRQTVSGELQAIPLSVDQKPENPKEKARIIKAGGRVEPLPGPPGEDCGPQRVWLAEVDVPGLAMSRSIGDEVSQTVGVISIPEIYKHTILSNDIFTIWASDGVWEFLSNEQACGIIWKILRQQQQQPNRTNKNITNVDLYLAAEALVEESIKQWQAQEEVIDDITVVLVLFNQPQ